MCGRFTLTVSGAKLAETFDLDNPPQLTARYNIAPTQQVALIRADGEGHRQCCQARWGLVPSWAKDLRIGARLINARCETVAVKPAFRAAVRHRRCLIPADGFYEWQSTAAGKQPYLIRFCHGRPFAMAGIWERWQQPDGALLSSCTIITTAANQVVAPVHDRMPVILSRSNQVEWLQPTPLDRARLEAILLPHPPAEMEAYPVSQRINSPAHDDPGCVQRVTADTYRQLELPL